MLSAAWDMRPPLQSSPCDRAWTDCRNGGGQVLPPFALVALRATPGRMLDLGVWVGLRVWALALRFGPHALGLHRTPGSSPHHVGNRLPGLSSPGPSGSPWAWSGQGPEPLGTGSASAPGGGSIRH